MTIRKIASLALATLAAVASLSIPARAGSVTYQVLVNSSGLAHGPDGLIDMQLNASFPPGPPSVSALVYNPSTDGTISSGASASDPAVGTAAGDLTTAGGVTMNNTAFSEVGQDFAVKSYFDVFVTLSGSEIGAGAVGPWSGTVFSLTVYDSVITDPGLSATFMVNPNIDGNGNPIIDGTVAVSTSGGNVMAIQQFSVPEPSSIALLGLGLGAVVAASGRRRWCR
jgi:PEP-CTERM motif